MADLQAARNDPEELLWAELEAAEAGMLGIEGSGLHLQPMAHFPDRPLKRLWFLTKLGTELYKSLDAGSVGQFVLVSRERDFHACLRGVLNDHYDAAKLDVIWNPVAAAWYTSKDDPDLKMLALDLQDAAIWASTGSSLVFAWETAVANLTDAEPDVGVHRVIVFA